MKETPFVERRREFRLPYNEKIIFSDGRRTGTAYGANISQGGIFIMTLDPLPIDAFAMLAFCLSTQSAVFCVKAKVVHIVFDRHRADLECGMGLEFSDITQAQQSLLNLYLLNQQSNYLELKKMLSVPKPNLSEISKLLRKFPDLESDLLALRYRVNRICAVFEPVPSLTEEEEKLTA